MYCRNKFHQMKDCRKCINKEILCLVVKSYESNALLFFNLVVPGPICFGTQVFKVHGIENMIFVCKK